MDGHHHYILATNYYNKNNLVGLLPNYIILSRGDGHEILVVCVLDTIEDFYLTFLQTNCGFVTFHYMLINVTTHIIWVYFFV